MTRSAREMVPHFLVSLPFAAGRSACPSAAASQLSVVAWTLYRVQPHVARAETGAGCMCSGGGEAVRRDGGTLSLPNSRCPGNGHVPSSLPQPQQAAALAAASCMPQKSETYDSTVGLCCQHRCQLSAAAALRNQDGRLPATAMRPFTQWHAAAVCAAVNGACMMAVRN